MVQSTIVVVGATGDLGGRIAKALIGRSSEVRALVRHNTASEKLASLRSLGATVVEADLSSVAEIKKATAGAACVVSTLSGLRDVIVDVQTALLEGALEAGVPHFIPSDFCISFTKMAPGQGRRMKFCSGCIGPALAKSQAFSMCWPFQAKPR